MKIDHPQGANLNDPDQIIEFFFGQNNSYHQIGNSFLQYDIKVRKDDNTTFNDEAMRMVKLALASTYKEARLATTGSYDFEHNKYVGQVSLIMRLTTCKVEKLILFFFGNIKENKTIGTSLRQILINNYETDVYKRKKKGLLPLEQLFGVCRTFGKITKNLGFHLAFKLANLQDIIYKILGDDNKLTFKNLYVFVPIFISCAQTQAIFHESIEIKFTISFDSWYIDKKIVIDGLEFHVDIGLAQNVNTPKYLIAAHQTLARIGVSNNSNETSIFDILDVRKYFREIERYRYPKDAVTTNSAENDCLDQY